MAILSEEQTQEILKGAMDEIRKAVVEEATRNAVWAVERAVSSKVNEIVNDFIQKEVAPEIVTSLQANKSQIIAAAIISADSMAVMLATSFSDTLAKKLGTSYERDKIFKAMFG